MNKKPDFAKYDPTPDAALPIGAEYSNPYYTPGDGIARVSFDTVSIEHRPASPPDVTPPYPAQLWVAFRYRGRVFVEYPLGQRHLQEGEIESLDGLLGSLQLHSV